MAWYDIFKPYDDSWSKSQRQLDAEAKYDKALKKAIADNPKAAKNPTGSVSLSKVIASGGSIFDEDDLAAAGFDKELKAAWDATQNFAVADDTYTISGTYTKAEKSKRKAEAAAAKKSIVTKVAEEEEEEAGEEEPSKLETAKTNMVNKANTTQSTGVETVATEQAKKDKKKGYKGGTIVTSPQGLLSSNDDALRPKRSLLASA